MIRRALLKGLVTVPFGNSRGQGFNNPLLTNYQVGNTFFQNGNIFQYSPTPGPNNLEYSLVQGTANITDRFGNVALPGSTYYSFEAGVYSAAQMGAAPGEGSAIQFYTSSIDQSGPYVLVGLVAANPNGMTIDSENIINILKPLQGPLATVHPGLPTRTPETPQTLPLASGWTAFPGNPPRYWLNLDGQSVTFTGQATHAAFSTTTVLSASPIPVGYWPAVAQDVPPAFVNSLGSTQGVNVTTAGVVQVRANSSSTTTVAVQGSYPLN